MKLKNILLAAIIFVAPLLTSAQVTVIPHYDAKKYIGNYTIVVDLTRGVSDANGKYTIVAMKKVGDDDFPIVAFMERNAEVAPQLRQSKRITVEPTLFVDQLSVTFYNQEDKPFFRSTLFPLDRPIKK